MTCQSFKPRPYFTWSAAVSSRLGSFLKKSNSFEHLCLHFLFLLGIWYFRFYTKLLLLHFPFLFFYSYKKYILNTCIISFQYFQFQSWLYFRFLMDMYIIAIPILEFSREGSKLYTPSTLNIDFIQWHAQLIVCAVEWITHDLIHDFYFTFQAYALPNTLNGIRVSLFRFPTWILRQL